MAATPCQKCFSIEVNCGSIADDPGELDWVIDFDEVTASLIGIGASASFFANQPGIGSPQAVQAHVVICNSTASPVTLRFHWEWNSTAIAPGNDALSDSAFPFYNFYNSTVNGGGAGSADYDLIVAANSTTTRTVGIGSSDPGGITGSILASIVP